MKQYKYLLLAICTMFILPVLYAQPDCAINPSDYEYTMTVTGIAVIHCQESWDENDIIAAFINGEVRGVQALNTDISGRKFAYMIIYDNDFTGNEITFKIYDASTDSVYDAKQSLMFSENAIHGNSDDPFIFNTDYNLTETFLSQDSIDENSLAGNVIAEINTINEIHDTVSLNYEFEDDAVGPDNHYFIISGNTLVLAEDVDAELKDVYQIHLSGATIDGCSRDDVFTLHVTGQEITAVDEIETSDDIIIYPNPATSFIHFATEKELERVCIYTIDGRSLHDTRNLSSSNGVDISFLTSGIYLVECYVDGAKRITKLMVQE